VQNVWYFLFVLAVMSLTGVSALAQHKYYARTVRRLARAHDEPGCVLVSGRAKSRFRGAIVVLVLHRDDEVIRAASVMQGASVLARFTDRPDWVGLSARDPLPGASPRVTAAVADARSHIPGRRSAPVPATRFRGAPVPRPVGGPRRPERTAR
jgi:glucitol operon activator protein